MSSVITVFVPATRGTDWQESAACRQEDPELFFPIGPAGPAKRQLADAKAVCKRCEVRPDCLLWALETGQQNGVRGGVSEQELRKIRDRANRTRSTRTTGKPDDGQPARQPQPQPTRTLPAP